MGDEKPAVLQLLGPSTGGIRRHVAELSTRLAGRGWEVRVAGPAGVMEGVGSQNAVVPVPTRPDPRAVLRARRLLQATMHDAALIHAHGLKAGWLASTLRPRTALVVTVHNLVLDEAEGRLAPPLRWLEGRLPARADATIAVSTEIARRFASVPRSESVWVVPPVGSRPEPPDVPAKEIRAQLGVGARPLVVVAARLHPQKDLDTFLQAIVHVQEDVPDVLAVILGAGPEDARLREKASALGLAGDEPSVRFLGHVPDAPAHLAAADAVALSSRWEGNSIAAAEALWLGRPLVATAVGELPHLVEDRISARLVAPGDPRAFADALVEVLRNREAAEAMGAAGKARVASLLDPDLLVTQVEAVYEAVLGS